MSTPTPGLGPTLLDRLDPEASSSGISPSARVRRDLEDLLNARRPWVHPPAGRSATPDDILQLGLPDMTALSVEYQNDELRLIATIQGAIRQFDRRLVSPRVSIEPESAGSGGIRFRVRSLLRAGGATESLDLDAKLEPQSHRFEVLLRRGTERAHAR